MFCLFIRSGIVVLAFGASNINQKDGKALYDSSFVHLYDTNSNKMYTQNISGTPPVPRASATGVLGNNEYTFNINKH
jgi:hypothetical protein